MRATRNFTCDILMPVFLYFFSVAYGVFAFWFGCLVVTGLCVCKGKYCPSAGFEAWIASFTGSLVTVIMWTLLYGMNKGWKILLEQAKKEEDKEKETMKQQISAQILEEYKQLGKFRDSNNSTFQEINQKIDNINTIKECESLLNINETNIA